MKNKLAFLLLSIVSSQINAACDISDPGCEVGHPGDFEVWRWNQLPIRFLMDSNHAPFQTPNSSITRNRLIGSANQSRTVIKPIKDKQNESRTVIS